MSARALVVTLVLVLMGACSSDDDAADATSLVTVAMSTTSVPATTTTDQTSTTSTTTTAVTASPSTTLSSTEPPTTIVQPVPDPETAIRQAIAAATDAFSACLLALPMCDPASLAATAEPPIVDINMARIQEWNAAGYEVRDRELFRYVIESVEIDPAGDTATAIVCIADGSKLVLPGAGPDSTDVIVDGTYVSGRESWQMRLGADGVWRVYEAPALGPTESSDVCPPG